MQINFAPSFKGHDTQDKYVISFDTEQLNFIKSYNELWEMVNDNIYEQYKTFASEHLSLKNVCSL
jgi:hypothetical protein